MARPQKEGLDYFPHDVDLSKNDEIGELEILYGNDGYAVYLKILERIYKKGDKLGISAAETMQILSRNCNVSVDRLKEILDKAVKIGLFSSVEYKNGFLISDEINRRMKPVFDKREKMQKKYEKGISAAETPPETTIVKERKGKESKEKESIVNEKNNIYTRWQEKGIVVHNGMNSRIETAIRGCLKEGLTEPDILRAIDNYAEILSNPAEYFFQYRWSLWDFLKRGVHKFLDIEISKSNYKRQKNAGKTESGSKHVTSEPSKYDDIENR